MSKPVAQHQSKIIWDNFNHTRSLAPFFRPKHNISGVPSRSFPAKAGVSRPTQPIWLYSPYPVAFVLSPMLLASLHRLLALLCVY